jgi:hypothetical protein
MTTPLAVLQTLWTTGAIRCVLVKQRQPPTYALQVFDGARVIYTELVEPLEQAGEVAATLWGIFVDGSSET